MLPPTACANATAASFPEHNSSPYSKSLIVIFEPFFSPNLDPPVPAAFAETSTVSSIFAFSSTTIPSHYFCC